MKTIEKHFAEWESHVFGFGYGTGEPHVLAALKGFMTAVGREGSPNAYEYEALERAVTAPVAWLLINALCHADIIEYGTSPRFGWLTPQGEALEAFTDFCTVERLEAMCAVESIDHCVPEFCNCGPDGYSAEKLCHSWPLDDGRHEPEA